MSALELGKLKTGFDAALAAEKGSKSVAAPIESGFGLTEPERREMEILRLKKLINKRRWNTDTNIQMVFPELGLDLRPANIKKIIADAGLTPDTEESHEYMENVWDRLEAERLYEYFKRKLLKESQQVLRKRQLDLLEMRESEKSKKTFLAKVQNGMIMSKGIQKGQSLFTR